MEAFQDFLKNRKITKLYCLIFIVRYLHWKIVKW